MIVPMKKYSFLIYHKEYLEFLRGLQELGVLHIIEKESGEFEDEELKNKYSLVKNLNEAIAFLEKRQITVEQEETKSDDGLEILSEIKSLWTEQEEYNLRLTNIKKDIAAISPWGNFSWENINKLDEAGLSLKFFTCSARQFNEEWESKYNIEHINDISGQHYFVLMSKHSEEISINAEEVKLPEKSLSKLIENKEDIEQVLLKTEDVLDDFSAKYISLLKNTRENIANQLHFERVVLNTQKEAEDKLMVLEGWVPQDKEDEVLDHLNKAGVFYEAAKPELEDAPPVKLKNNKFARLFEGIGELYSMPNYGEIDLTVFFAPFFMLFFGFCLGDAGYGLLFLIGATLYKLKADKKVKPVLTLVQFLGLATVIFGALTGTIFGINLIDSGYTITESTIVLLQQQNIPSEIIDQLGPFLNETVASKSAFENNLSDLLGADVYSKYDESILKYTESNFPVLNSVRYLFLDPNKMFNLALILGAIQIIFGMFIKAANQIKMYGHKHAFSTIGWLLLILGGATIYFLNSTSKIESATAKTIFVVVLIISSLGIYIFNDPKRNVFVNIGAGLWDTYNMVTGILGDLLSYIRLFALGISSAILGFVFNDLALNMSPDLPVAKQLVFVIILLIGHGINIFMSGLGSFVHPLRLTFVEFYKNAGFIGGGKKYNPFSK